MRLFDGKVRYCLEWPVAEVLPFANALLEGIQVDWGTYVGVSHGRGSRQ